MDIRLMIQSTPNPNALKFVMNIPVKGEGNYTYKKDADCTHNPLAQGIFDINSAVQEVYFFDNYITVTQDGSADWDELEERIRATILDKAPTHDPHFMVIEPEPENKVDVQTSPEIDQINSILDQTVRPALQMDGGDIQLMSYDDKILKIFYQGACGSCPSASMGTMKAIENILRDQYDPQIVVELADVY